MDTSYSTRAKINCQPAGTTAIMALIHYCRNTLRSVTYVWKDRLGRIKCRLSIYKCKISQWVALNEGAERAAETGLVWVILPTKQFLAFEAPLLHTHGKPHQSEGLDEDMFFGCAYVFGIFNVCAF